MVKKWYDYETESGDELMLSPRMHFRNMVKVREIMGFPFNLTVSGDLYKEPFDVYTFQDDEIIVINPQACIECNACVVSCPQKAITLVEVKSKK